MHMTKDRIETFKTALSKLRDSMYATFLRTKALPQDQKDLFFKYIDMAKSEFDPKDPAQREFDVIKATSFEDIELIRNIDYLYRLFEEIQADIDASGTSIWFHAAPKQSKLYPATRSMQSRVIEAPKPAWIDEATEHLWDKAVQQLSAQDSIVNEDGDFDYNGAMAVYQSLLKDELAKAKKQFDVMVQNGQAS